MFKGSAQCKDFEEDFLRDRFKADPQRVKQILTNLLSNAIKFTPANGCVTLKVWVSEETAILRVEDTGIGISKAEISLFVQQSGMDSYQIIRTLQGDLATQEIKILALLTDDSQEEKAHYRAAGASDC